MTKTSLAKPEIQAARFSRIREAHQTETTEDYVELIADLIDVQGEARPADLAERFGVSAPTVNKTIQRLVRDGFVTQRPYRALFLTEKGEKLAAESKARHEIVLAFLLKLGVPAETAEADAEGIEHHISPETLQIFERFL
ncbi:MAG: manganese-binding transcriptional regulator MntR [Alphaproteobacteria bacterium]|nr:manganese-binding transcriptional regulator MntR [Alphaproteobacteria bacterium]